MKQLILGCFLAVSFSVCFLSFAFCYAFNSKTAFRETGEVRSLSGIMKSPILKPYFCFVMGCLGGSVLFDTGVQANGELPYSRRTLMLCLILGMYVSLLGLLNYDIAYSKNVHYGFVFGLILTGYVFANLLLNSGTLCLISALVYNAHASVFLACFIYNSYLLARRLIRYQTLQSFLEFCWVLSHVLLMLVYGCQSTEPHTNPPDAWLIGVLGVCFLVCGIISSLFYVTPDLGYVSGGGIQSYSYIIAKTPPHLSFLLQILCGLVLLCLLMSCAQTAVSIIVIILLYVFSTGLLTFDILSHEFIHRLFSYGWCFIVVMFCVAQLCCWV
jgi:hypothetical protein